ncbi:DNA methylase, N-6 adenine-specific, eukaryotic [Ostreococcus tauri]|uniref:DNA methylase, N-6 adenine-specific, eukaryotic n=1 Tax=Ostreococcus tauri TaxID=70448 RepID=A0A090LXK2_OSTTA|nr:DNA methylase, N-6 adenine-specific, eukaryotic [Ostreococcus tauri]CEF96536.1 DNA methylase, N-6 adenine-specific, eukaryotic [Ostreococcus tauri]|eukprot:XP_003074163.2 DNA methylase, N-6 adenine-specific, eukaryotic [Ostreococcus tauri]
MSAARARVVAHAAPRRARRKGDRPKGAPATTIAPAECSGIAEDHALEQFFYSDETLRRLLRVAKRYERPLFVCNPTLAVAWEREVGETCVLLDCDVRFKGLVRGFKRFDLRRPVLMTKYAYDVVFVDPPFANVSPKELKTCLDMIAGTVAQREAPVYVAFNADREEELDEAFGGTLTRVEGRALGYKSVKEAMQEKIWLFGPKI